MTLMTSTPFILVLSIPVWLAWHGRLPESTPRGTHGPVSATTGASCSNNVLAGRSAHALTYDPVGRRVLLFGGQSDDSTDHWPRSLWSWDGRAWTCLSGDGPPGRDSPEITFDARRNRLVLYGGRTRENRQNYLVLTDTWEWDGARWTLADTAGPGERIHMALAYDPARGAVLLYGGLRPPNEQLRDTWEWTGSRWRAADVAVGPAAQPNALVTTADGILLSTSVADSAADCPVSRGYRGRAHSYRLRDAAWQALGSTGPCVNGGGLYGIAWTPDGVVLYAGWSSDSTHRPESWILRAGGWQRIDSAPSRRRSARMIYDPNRRRVVLFGGNNERGVLNDTWEWDGARWSRIDAGAGPAR